MLNWGKPQNKQIHLTLIVMVIDTKVFKVTDQSCPITIEPLNWNSEHCTYHVLSGFEGRLVRGSP